jgi:hypothetical protein
MGDARRSLSRQLGWPTGQWGFEIPASFAVVVSLFESDGCMASASSF